MLSSTMANTHMMPIMRGEEEMYFPESTLKVQVGLERTHPIQMRILRKRSKPERIDFATVAMLTRSSRILAA